MLHLRSTTLLLLLAVQWASVSCAPRCEGPEGKCDFVCDCDDCRDEQDCGYRGKTFECDFEDAGICGWTVESSGDMYRWDRHQGGDKLSDSGPSSDYTIGTATGHTGLGSAPLWASILRRDSQEAVVWRPEASSTRSWREATIFLGAVPSAFRIRLHSQRSEGRTGDVAVDQLEFLDCALPSPPPGTECPAGMKACNRGGCVEQRQLCDGSDDCGDRSDEENCDGYHLCDFEKDQCHWDLRSLSKLKWIRTNQENISRSDPFKGPGRDHSNNTVSGHFLYVTVPDAGLSMDWAAFQSPPLQPTNRTHPCKMVMYTHQFGPRSGGLTVMVSDVEIYPVWKRGGALGDLWVKAEVEIEADFPFQIVIMAAIRDFAYGGIAVDSIVLSPGCCFSPVNHSLEAFPKPPKNPCIDDPNKICDFHVDCAEEEDEAKCGDFSYPDGSSGWTDTSVGSQGWVLLKNATTKEDYLYVAEASGQQLTEAQIRTPLLGPTGPVCNLSFDFALAGSSSRIGELSVRVIDSLLGVGPKLWEFSGKTGNEEDAWQHAGVHVGARKHRFQLAFEAHAVKIEPNATIKVRNVNFISCHANYYPSAPTGLSCNFEDGLCGWYQDTSDNFDWFVISGMDHTIGTGRSLVVDTWSPSLRGAFGRLISFPQPQGSTDYCLSFFYKLYGPNTGALNVKLADLKGYEVLLWTGSGAHGNVWHEAQCPVPQQLVTFQLIFEVVRSGFDGRVAIDDVAFLDRPCTIPRMCSFEGQRCGYSSSSKVHWLHRNGYATTVTGPKTDHTLETELGYYMMVNTAADILPARTAATLSSLTQPGTTRTQCVYFWYHMGGLNPGILTVYVKPERGARLNIFSDYTNLGDVWRQGNGNVTSVLDNWQLEFEVVGTGGENSHVAVDDIYLSAHPCEDQVSGSRCSLEDGLCRWSNTQNLKLDKLDWELTSHEAEQHYSTPIEDHTLGTEKGHFLFLPSSNRTPTYQKAWLLSPHLPPNKLTCLRFWAYKPYSSDFELKVWRVSRGLVSELLAAVELGGPWKRFEANITLPEEYQIVFEGIKGTSGVVALDDIEYIIGRHCGKMNSGSTSNKPYSAGGIAATVIVVLLLVGTLIGLLVFYLRAPGRAEAADHSASSAAGGFSNEAYDSDLAVPDEAREREVA